MNKGIDNKKLFELAENSYTENVPILAKQSVNKASFVVGYCERYKEETGFEEDAGEESQDELHQKLYPEASAKPEYIICAAIWFKDDKKHEHQPKNVEIGFVICARRHHNVFATVSAMKADSLFDKMSEAKKNAVQGFVTSKDRFVDRKEGGEIAFSAKQIQKPTNCLFSEDLY